MPTNAVRALRHMSHGDGNELLGVGRQCAVSKNSLAELPEGTFDFRRKLSPQFTGCQLRANGDGSVHFHSPAGISSPWSTRTRRVPGKDCGHQNYLTSDNIWR